MNRCDKCGAESPGFVAFCGECGAPVKTGAPQAGTTKGKQDAKRRSGPPPPLPPGARVGREAKDLPRPTGRKATERMDTRALNQPRKEPPKSPPPGKPHIDVPEADEPTGQFVSRPIVAEATGLFAIPPLKPLDVELAKYVAAESGPPPAPSSPPPARASQPPVGLKPSKPPSIRPPPPPSGAPSNGAQRAPAQQPAQSRPGPSISVAPHGEAFDDVDAGFEAIVSSPPTPLVQKPEEAARDRETDMRAARDLFLDLVPEHGRSLRDFVIELSWLEPRRDWLDVALPAAREIGRGASEMEMPELAAAMSLLVETLVAAEAAAPARHRRAGGPPLIAAAQREPILGAYDELVRLMPETFGFEDERALREGAIVDALLEPIPGVHLVVKDRLLAAGFGSLKALLGASLADVAERGKLARDVAARVVDRCERFLRDVEATTPDRARGPELERLAHLIGELGARHAAVTAREVKRGSSPPGEAARLEAARLSALGDVRVALAKLGERSRLAELDRLPMARKIAALARHAAALKAGERPGPLTDTSPKSDGGSAAADRDRDQEDMPKPTREDVLKRVAEGVSLAGADLTGLDLSKAKLDDIDLRRADLEGANLEGASLRGAKMRGASLRDAFLAGADLRGADLDKADAKGANFTRATLDGANLSRADLEGAVLTRASLLAAKLSAAELGGAQLGGAELEKAILSHAELDGAYLGGVKAASADFTDANLSGATLESGDFTGSILRGANLAGALARGVKLVDAQLVKADLSKATLVEADLTNADLRNATLAEAKLDGATLTGAKVAGLNATGAQLTNLIADWVDQSPKANDTKRVPKPNVVAALAGRPVQTVSTTRYFGQGDVLRNAALEFGAGANVHIESRFEDCTIAIGKGTELVVGKDGVLAGCQITGAGNVTVHGQFFEQGRTPGMVGPAQLVVSAQGAFVGAVRQPAALTRFAFEPGCKLRMKILKDER
ncbi:MAG TPA: pentapeptide repeat-containing protein [Byssovorax sp.]|jgi:uncharacterized protein YjbI with pentapeptide repeats